MWSPEAQRKVSKEENQMGPETASGTKTEWNQKGPGAKLVAGYRARPSEGPGVEWDWKGPEA